MMNYAGLDKELLLERAGEFIVNARKKNGITQEGLLRLIDKGCNLNMDRNTLSLIERGRVATNWLNLMVIQHVLGFSFPVYVRMSAILRLFSRSWVKLISGPQWRCIARYQQDVSKSHLKNIRKN